MIAKITVEDSLMIGGSLRMEAQDVELRGVRVAIFPMSAGVYIHVPVSYPIPGGGDK
jgi:hypothetical protein